MREWPEIGFMPDGQGNALVGVITDRDIAVRGVGRGSDGATPIHDVMSTEVPSLFRG
jgi:CBS domain-containing protein